jgi:cytochrome c553
VTESSIRGERIATGGIDVTMIPACVECHGPAASPKNPAYPRLAGQHADYLRAQLRLMQRRQRGGSEYVELMHEFIDRLSDEQIDDVTAYFASLSDR